MTRTHAFGPKLRNKRDRVEEVLADFIRRQVSLTPLNAFMKIFNLIAK